MSLNLLKIRETSHKNATTLYWFNFFTDFILFGPVAIIYFSHVSGSYMLGMSIFSIAMVSAALFEIPTGIFSDLLGRKKTIILGALSIFIGYIFYATGTHYWMLVIGAIFEGLSRAFYSGNNDALLYDSLTDIGEQHKYHHILGKVGSMFQIAAAVSAVLGSAIAAYSFPLVMWLSTLAQLICLILAFRIIEPKQKSNRTGNVFIHLKESLQNFIKNKKLRLLSFANMIDYGFGEAGFQFRSAFVQTLWPIWAIGLSRVLSNIGSAISYIYSGRLVDKFKPLKILLASKIYNRIIMSIAYAFPSVLSPVLIPTGSVFHGVENVSLNTLFQKEFTGHQRATMASLNSLVGSLFFGLVAVIFGLTADKIGPAKTLFFAQLFQLVVVWIYWRLFRHEKNTNR